MFRHALKQSETYSRARRNRLSAEIREKYKDDPEAVIHAAMMLVGQQNVNAQKVLDDAKAGDSSQKDSSRNIRSRTSSENRTSSLMLMKLNTILALHIPGPSAPKLRTLATEDAKTLQAGCQ